MLFDLQRPLSGKLGLFGEIAKTRVTMKHSGDIALVLI